MTKKQIALANITAAIADGDTRTAMRIYCENRISRSDYDDAIARGMRHIEIKEQATMKPNLGQLNNLMNRLYSINHNAAFDFTIEDVGESDGKPAVWLSGGDDDQSTLFTFEGRTIYCDGDSRW